jgi:excisionase family DNA binding protein
MISRETKPGPPAIRWVSLSHATTILGVNQSTVRRWADTGLVRAYRTPGGHRRLAEADLLALTEATPERLQLAATSRIQRDLNDRSLVGWRDDLATERGEALRPLGRRLLQLVGDAIARRRPQQLIEAEVDEIGRDYGALLVKSHMPLPSAIEAFTFFRRSLDETARFLAERRELDVDEAARTRENIAMLADRVLACVAAAYADPQRNGTH